MAQTTDPFGEVNDSTYQNTMTITGYVRMASLVNGAWTAINDEVLGNETVVAVYCGDEVRGKGSPADYNNKYFSLLILSVFGESKDQFHFKVFIPGDSESPGRVIEIDQGITFKTDDRIGKLKEPYYIDLPMPVTTTFSEEGWATTCLPFNAEVPEGVTVWNATGVENGELVMETVGVGIAPTSADEGNSQSPTILPANTPVLLSVSEQAGTNASATWLARVANGNVEADGSILSGTTEPITVDANSVLTLGHSNDSGEIGFWRFTGTTIPANRAYIANLPAGVKGVRLGIDDGTATGISDVQCYKGENDNWFTLDGRRLSRKPSQHGVYVNNGCKILIK